MVINLWGAEPRFHADGFRHPTLPDPPSVDVDLDGEARVQRLVVVQDEDVAAQGVDAGGVHRCILGNG